MPASHSALDIEQLHQNVACKVDVVQARHTTPPKVDVVSGARVSGLKVYNFVASSITLPTNFILPVLVFFFRRKGAQDGGFQRCTSVSKDGTWQVKTRSPIGSVHVSSESRLCAQVGVIARSHRQGC